jgi:hypothetical protein
MCGKEKVSGVADGSIRNAGARTILATAGMIGWRYLERPQRIVAVSIAFSRNGRASGKLNESSTW